MKAYLLHQLNNYDEAIATYQQSFIILDSVRLELLNIQSQFLEQDYLSSQNTLQNENEKISRYFILLSSLVLFILLLLYYLRHVKKTRCELKENENMIQKMMDRAIQADEAKTNFLNKITSLINKPLQSIVDGSLKIAEANNLTDHERGKILENLNKNSVKILSLINQILDLSRLEAGFTKVDIQEIELSTLLDELQSVFEITDHSFIAQNSTKKFKLMSDKDLLLKLLHSLNNNTPTTLSLGIQNESFLQVEFFDTELSTASSTSSNLSVRNEYNQLLAQELLGHYSVGKEKVSITLPLCII